MKVLFFGVLRDVVGRAEDALELEPGARAGDVFDRYAREFPKLAGMGRSVVVARNQRFSEAAEPLEDGDEITLVPPLGGG